MQIFCLFCKKNLLFSILHTHFYKTHTSVCLFYHLFYLNNLFPHFFYYFISNSLSLSIHETLSIPTETLLFETPLHHGHSLIQAPRLADPHAPILTDPQASIQALILTNPQAPICHKWRSTSVNPLSLSLLVCSCVGLFDFLVSVVDFLFLWLIFDFVSVGVCVSEEERKWWGRECVGFADGKEREKKRNEIINY